MEKNDKQKEKYSVVRVFVNKESLENMLGKIIKNKNKAHV